LPLHGNLAALVYLNSKRRLGCGPLNTERLEIEAAEEVRAALALARHPETNEALFEDVFSLREILGCDPIARDLPDVIGIPAPGWDVRLTDDPARRLIVPNPGLPAHHRREGILLVEGPQISAVWNARDGRPAADMRDLAPTLLHLLGLQAPVEMTGRALFDEDCARSAMPMASVVSRSNESSPYQPDEQALIESRLRDLGYLD